MAILSEKGIKQLIKDEDALLPVDEQRDLENMLEGPTLNLRLGHEAYVSSQAVPVILDEERNPTISVEPGEFALLMTYEEIKIPDNLIGLIEIRFRYKLYGLINVSGFHVDPGFNGRLIFSVYNAGPRDIVLRYKEPVFMIVFAQLAEETKQPYEGRFEGMRSLPLDAITGLRGASVSPIRLSSRIDKVEMELRIYGGILATLTVGVLIVVIRWLTGGA